VEQRRLIECFQASGPDEWWRTGRQAMEKKWNLNSWHFVAIFVGITILQSLWSRTGQVELVPYSDIQRYLEADQVEELVVSETHVYGVFKLPLANGKREFAAVRIDPDLAKDLASYDVKVSGATEQTFLKQMLGWVLPAAIFVGIWFFALRRLADRQGMGGGLMSIGKSKAKVYVESDTKVSFDDVAGVDEAKAELQETVAFLKNPKTYGRLGARIPKGVLLVGPPGTGKTLLARAVAGEAGVPFFSISGSEFVEMFVGVGAARVRDLFLQARAKAPCIIFIDELDALGRARGAFPGMGGHDEKEQTLNQLLVELDGFDPGAEGMVLLAATNRPEILDPALLRAGRFDRQVLVDRPDRAGREQILRVHLKRVETDPAIDVDAIASLTPGFTGADLANLVNEAALLATRRRGEAVTGRDFTEAFERTVAGLEKRNRLINPHEREVVAHHEMGHALVATKLSGSDPVHKVSIIPRGIGSLGYTIQRPTEDRYLMTLDELENKMAVLLGGRAAETLIFGKLSTGAADDLNKATDIARSIVMRYGMSAALGEMTYDREPALLMPGAYTPGSKQDYSEETAREIDCAVRELVASASKLASHVLEAHRSILEAGAARLLKSETLSAEELREIVAGVTPAPRAVDETRQADVLAIQRGENEGMRIGS
jgi:cell division protease FtsH